MKKFLLTLAFGVMGFALAGCSNNAKSDNSDGSKTFLIGSMGPLTGGAASYGNSVKNGFEIAVDEINAAGGIAVGKDTYKFKLSFKDDEAMEDKAVTAYNALVDEGMGALLGGTTSGSTLAVTDLSHKDNILQITPSGSVQEITANDNVFRLCFTDPIQGQLIAKYVIDNDYDSIAVMYNNSDEYSTGVYKAFEEELNKLGKADILKNVESFTTQDIDFTTQLTKIKASEPKAVFIPAYYEAVAQITKQAKSIGLKADLIGSDGWDGVLAQVTDPSVLEGAVFLTPFMPSSEDENVKKFVEEYKKRHNAVPDQFAADAYDTAYVLKTAMEHANSIQTEDLIKAMTEIKVEGLTGDVTFEASGEPNKKPNFVQIKNGEYVQYKK